MPCRKSGYILFFISKNVYEEFLLLFFFFDRDAVLGIL